MDSVMCPPNPRWERVRRKEIGLKCLWMSIKTYKVMFLSCQLCCLPVKGFLVGILEQIEG